MLFPLSPPLLPGSVVGIIRLGERGDWDIIDVKQIAKSITLRQSGKRSVMSWPDVKLLSKLSRGEGAPRTSVGSHAPRLRIDFCDQLRFWECYYISGSRCIICKYYTSLEAPEFSIS